MIASDQAYYMAEHNEKTFKNAQLIHTVIKKTEKVNGTIQKLDCIGSILYYAILFLITLLNDFIIK